MASESLIGLGNICSYHTGMLALLPFLRFSEANFDESTVRRLNAEEYSSNKYLTNF